MIETLSFLSKIIKCSEALRPERPAKYQHRVKPCVKKCFISKP
jgi:hypothetical protein